MTDFHRNTNSDKGATRVTHEAKASSAGSTDGSGLLGSVFGRRSAAAMPAVPRGSEGSGAPSSRRTPVALIALLAISLVALFASAALAA